MKTRTMIYLETEQLRALKDEAKNHGISLAELLRRLVEQHLLTRRRVPAAPADAFRRIVGLGSSGHKDTSERHDTYLAKALRREHAG